ncbi:LOW QUALITY PROTEIN: hypothetical protein ColTof4_14010 [Colletotrichum tofieldiae]|nr:LOW QUALITY PROTEIN: hypothetical protein ColTof3_14643 [Colletotrichum tofieldiae]GKT81587.1 LOW QUALITY PROTEIN: hypothetical protein ColTof4_14010 [Colletotrichum tofieldiae]GKT97564.1 LOW QUALITY PROTEIN: hypothetical protein Ct61P_15414 [Colletotrichum tofieldiae]
MNRSFAMVVIVAVVAVVVVSVALAVFSRRSHVGLYHLDLFGRLAAIEHMYEAVPRFMLLGDARIEGNGTGPEFGALWDMFLPSPPPPVLNSADIYVPEHDFILDLANVLSHLRLKLSTASH